MTKKNLTKPVAALIGAFFAGSLSATSPADTTDNPFNTLQAPTPSDYTTLVEDQAKDQKSRCGAGKCGGDSGKTKSRCGAGKCGGDPGKTKSRCGAGKCGGDPGMKDKMGTKGMKDMKGEADEEKGFIEKTMRMIGL